MANTTYVTHPDGTRSKRTSAKAIYTHAVVISPAPAEAWAHKLEAEATTYRDRARALRARADEGRVTVADRGFRSNEPGSLSSHVAKLAGTDLYTWCSAEGITTDFGDDYKPGTTRPEIHVAEYMLDYARRYATDLDAEAEKKDVEAAAVRAADVPVGQWGVLRWSSRADLATKAAGAEFVALATGGKTVTVVPVDPT